jgi:hypothetical protein
MKVEILQTTRNSVGAAGVAGVLLRDLIDYAGLFAPASLDMPTAVANYHAYSRSEWRWVLGHFVVPVARLGEFEEALAELPAARPGANVARWRLSVLLGSDPVAEVASVREFNVRMATVTSIGGAVVESVEIKAVSAEQIRWLSGIIPSELTTYFETSSANCWDWIAAVADCGRRAKLRTGGEAADKFPSPAGVMELIRRCSTAKVPFKATAGLHHPLRSVHRLTYQPDSPSGIMHGFLNVFLAAAFLRSGMTPELAGELLEEQRPEVFRFDLDGVRWRKHRLGANEIDAARRRFAVSFGSCSFTEPIDDLRCLHLL